MTAASFWSLLAPAIEISEASMGSLAFIPVAVGFALGALFVHLSDNLIPRYFKIFQREDYFKLCCGRNYVN